MTEPIDAHRLTEDATFATKADALRHRTKQFALRVISLCDRVERNGSSSVLLNQLLRSATSVGAHYREASRARSIAEFASKLQVALQEGDESIYWLELLLESGKADPTLVQPQLIEANELVSILVASVKSVKASQQT
jgi:four helix bundle protein